jgi:sulfoxide reductase catalytic subunit YedY
MNATRKFRSSEITPEDKYFSRRRFLKLGAMATTAFTIASCAAPPKSQTQSASTTAPQKPALEPTKNQNDGILRDELGDPANSYDDITHFNNYYEFTTDKEMVASAAASFKTSPWKVSVGGLVNNPKTFDIDDLNNKFPAEERIYRMRCVEGWSMVIPWNGFALSRLLKEVEPNSKAKYVRFESFYDPTQAAGQTTPFYNWPYIEGLRLDEAMNDLSLLVTGVYGKPLPNQNGAPLRLAVPWKYGFKSIKGIVKIDLVEEQPTSLWMAANPGEYGFYSNVNPNKSHPRWSQKTERRIGEASRRRTLMYNGYDLKVAELYTGLDLNANY